MHSAVIPLFVFIGLLGWAAVQPAASQSAPGAAQPVDASLSGQSDAAEKHAKRTACLKDAKSKKLVGAQKTAYVKDCMTNAASASSSSSSGSAASSVSP